MLGVVAQDTTLDLELTVRENLLVYARYFDDRRAPRPRARADELLTLMAPRRPRRTTRWTASRAGCGGASRSPAR